MVNQRRSGGARDVLADAWGTWIQGLGRWDLFGGLTYDQRRRPYVAPGRQKGEARLRLGPRLTEDGRVRLGGERRPGRDSAVANVQWFLREGQRQLGRPIEAAVVALEYQRNGWPHFHPLLRLAGGLQEGDVATLGPIWFKVAGYGCLEVPRGAQEVCEYAAKYLSKGLDTGDLVLWPKRGKLRAAQLSLMGQGSG